MFEEFQNPNAGIKKAEKMQIDAEKRDHNFQREQNVMGNALHPSDDQTYMVDQENKADLLKWQQNMDDELIKLILALQGRRLINKELIKVNEPLCDNQFIYDVVIPQCEPYLNRNLFNTNYDTKTILSNLRNTMNDIDDAMADNYQTYNIDFTNFDLVHRMIVNTIKPGIFRALNGWTKKTDSTIAKQVETINNHTQEEKKKGWFGS